MNQQHASESLVPERLVKTINLLTVESISDSESDRRNILDRKKGIHLRIECVTHRRGVGNAFNRFPPQCYVRRANPISDAEIF
jgi:hypothetical protein